MSCPARFPFFSFRARFRKGKPREDPLPLQPRPHLRPNGPHGPEDWSRFVGEAAAECCPPRRGGPLLEAAADEDADEVDQSP